MGEAHVCDQLAQSC